MSFVRRRVAQILVAEEVAEVAIAGVAHKLRPKLIGVGLLTHRVLLAGVEAGPAAAHLKLRLAGVQLRAAARAAEDAVLEEIGEPALRHEQIWFVGDSLTERRVRFRRQLLAPRPVGFVARAVRDDRERRVRVAAQRRLALRRRFAHDQCIQAQQRERATARDDEVRRVQHGEARAVPLSEGAERGEIALQLHFRVQK